MPIPEIPFTLPLIYFHLDWEFSNPRVLGSFLPVAISLYFFAIKKEEKYLEEKFGEEYFNYKKKVRRWI